APSIQSNAPDIFSLLDLSTSIVERTLQYRRAPHSIMGLFGRKKNPSGAPSSSGKQSSRWKKIWRWKLRDSNNISPVQNEYEVNNAASVTGPNATSVELLHSESCPTNNNPIPNDGRVTAALTSSWDLAYEALREEKPEIMQAYEELLSKTLPYLKKTSYLRSLTSRRGHSTRPIPK
ncbi:uncharacterized protein PpBr36_10328, partial [Pyricularia pennisetigena]|uniref:uncharacterized protein n=1 Tax=Pyricularia pennisetigena TaxID=1578925 RepID=UPI001151B48E